VHNYAECHELRQHNSNTNLSVGNKYGLHSSSCIFDNFWILRRNFEVAYYDFTKVAFYKLYISKLISFHQRLSKAMTYKPLVSFSKQCRRDGRKPGKITGSRLCCFCFGISGYYRYLPTVQINPFRPNSSYSVTESHSFPL